MGAKPPFLYDPVPKDSSRDPYSNFDPKAVSRASLTPRAPRPKPDGPLVSLNRHPDSYFILPYGNTNTATMNPSIKKWVKWMRFIQLTLRCLELLGAVGLLVIMILIKNVDVTIGWVMRIAPGVAILHAVYGIYHLARRPSGRTPASSASYMLFAALFDVSIIPFYAFSALVARTREAAWETILSDQDLMPIFSNVIFLLATVSGSLHLISLTISSYLAVTFRKITKLPPDMNPLEDNLTARPHKRNKSSVSTPTMSEKRNSLPLESKRSSGAAYEDLSRPPTIPFFHTRTGSNESLSTFQSTPPGSRGLQIDLPSRQYQIETNTSRPATADLKRDSIHGSTPPSYHEFLQSDTASQRILMGPYKASSPPKRSSYTEVPLSERSTPPKRNSYARAPLSDCSSPPKHSSYTEVPLSDGPPSRSTPPMSKTHPVREAWYNSDILNTSRIGNTSPKKGQYQPLQQSLEDLSINHPNGLGANPPTLRSNKAFRPQRESPLSEISNNRTPSSSDIASVSNYSQDGMDDFPKRGNSGNSRNSRTKSKYYGELKPAAQQKPVLVGISGNRQVSSGIDFSSGIYSSERGSFRRDVSGKVAEEGRAEGSSWVPRYRKVSGILQ